MDFRIKEKMHHSKLLDVNPLNLPKSEKTCFSKKKLYWSKTTAATETQFKPQTLNLQTEIASVHTLTLKHYFVHIRYNSVRRTNDF